MQKPEIDQDRCLRYRCRSSTCTRCSDACPLDCIQLSTGALAVDTGSCTSCMLCVAVCPSDGFKVPDTPFMDIIATLQTMDGLPVLGCTLEPESCAHARLRCLGALAEEHLAALAVFLPQGVQLNAESCGRCMNSFILPTLKGRIAWIASFLPREIASRLTLVEKSRDLAFQVPSLDRRTFFRTLGRDLASTAAGLILRESERPAVPRAEKHVPLKRNLVNETAHSLPERAREQLLDKFRHELQFDEKCTLCPRCAAVCPTGALKRNIGEGSERLDFSAELCTGCALCVDFCPSDAISMVCPGDDSGLCFGQSTRDDMSSGSRERSDIDPVENVTR